MTGTMCQSCARRLPKSGYRPTCEAFPEGIPLTLYLGQVSHTSPVDGDHGLRWVPKKGFDFLIGTGT